MTLQAQAQLFITHVFPHDCECTVPRDQKLTSLIDSNNGGSGMVMLDIPHKKIFRNTLNELLEEVKSVNLFDPDVAPPGNQIFPNTYERNKIKVYPFDIRLYEYLPSPNHNYFNQMILQEHWHMANIRLWYWVVCKLSATEDSFPIYDLVGGNQGYYPIWPVPQNAQRPHLRCKKGALLWGCHEKTDDTIPTRQHTRKAAVDQAFHCDFHDKEEEVLGKKQMVTVSENPKLVGRTKPGSFIIPMEDWREIRFLSNGKPRVVRVPFGKILYFVGDTVHGGVTIPRSVENPDLGTLKGHWSYHLYWDSSLHPMIKDHFQIIMEGLAYYGRDHACYLNQKEYQGPMLGKLMEHTEEAARILKGGRANMNKVITHIRRMQDIVKDSGYSSKQEGKRNRGGGKEEDSDSEEEPVEKKRKSSTAKASPRKPAAKAKRSRRS